MRELKQRKKSVKVSSIEIMLAFFFSRLGRPNSTNKGIPTTAGRLKKKSIFR
jgi:hypothetical protein